MPTECPRAQFTGCTLSAAFGRYLAMRPLSASPPFVQVFVAPTVPPSRCSGEMRCVFHINKTLMFADHSVLDKMAHWRLPAAFENEQDKYYSPH